MPAKDIYHDAVKNALVKDGWKVTHDPLRLTWGGKDMYVDLGAERLLAAEKAGQKIVVEITSYRLRPTSGGDIAMDTLDTYRQIIENVLIEYTTIPYAYGDIQTEAIFDRKNDRYVLMNVGWDSGKRVHGSLVHIDIINGKVWIQRDGTEHGVAKELVKAGIPKDHIVLGFRPAEVRQYTEYATA
jgi:hypothetical protein